jgi:hypothetical protein
VRSWLSTAVLTGGVAELLGAVVVFGYTRRGRSQEALKDVKEEVCHA